MITRACLSVASCGFVLPLSTAVNSAAPETTSRLADEAIGWEPVDLSGGGGMFSPAMRHATTLQLIRRDYRDSTKKPVPRWLAIDMFVTLACNLRCR